MKTVELTCIVCPMGCALTVTQNEDGSVLSVKGNTCPRGAEYAKAEVQHPTRTLTTTVKTASGKPIPVKTDRPIPKEHLFDAMKKINSLRIDPPVEIGSVLMEDLYGANLIATADVGGI